MPKNSSKQKRSQKLPQDVQAVIEADVADATKTRWEIIGECGMDAGMLVITDPCYTLPQLERAIERGKGQPGTDAEFTYKDCCGPYPGDADYKGDAKQINFLRGHAGAGVRVNSPHGDGSVTIYAKLDAKNRVRSVFFSFDGEQPPE